MTSFLAIDFETADTQPDSACSVGLVRVENGLIVQEVMKLIRPPREKIMFTYVHGLTWEHVCDAPNFGEIWPEVAPLFRGVDYLIAHNASFDRRVLEACCASHGIEVPALSFKCTVQIARKSLGIYPTKLSDVCRTLEIDLNHHEALSDARACAKIMIRAMAHESGSQSFSAVEG
jgi:DNA polymerase III subunit epsilon